MRIFEEVYKSLQNNLPFVVYKKPNARQIKSFFQQNDELFLSEDFNESGFVFAPFDNKKPTILIPENKAEVITEELSGINTFNFSQKNETVLNVNDEIKKSHVDLVKSGVEAIADGNFKKVVLSRCETVKTKGFYVVKSLQKMMQTYSNAFVYLWFHPKVGMWMGATPETLLDFENNVFKTMSLAGTQLYKEGEEIDWGAKELDEQQLVTDYIIEKLKEVSFDLNVAAQETFKIGSLLHLRTKITGKALASNIKDVVKVLHPTPAVCGYPAEVAKEFIQKNENYDRAYYTGFLGELNLKVGENTNSSLFVNLRCMQIKENEALVYVGGGITLSSNPEKEWEETVIKSRAMKSML
ncbi:isochorismate synthase [uncultured Tenacibaculum sp.]|uniref:isochorismate synthase n=1 Tax=uncultured Tenacibaculum sp. TaxID=174713 RepID=UPI002635B4D8|nr:isochorismate synthase [uncultured Tenacibaculum sp.]